MQMKTGPKPARPAPRRRDALFPKYAHDYFEQLRQQYLLMLDNTATVGPSAGQTLTPPPTILALIQAYEADPTRMTWSDVFTLETAYLFAIHDDRLQSEVLLFRSRYNDVAGAETYAAYAKTVPADVTTMNIRQLRAELMTLAERLRYLYTFIPPRESTRNRLATSAGIWTLIAALIGGAVYWYFHGKLSTFWVVFFIGEMGGFLSVQHRLQKIEGGDPLFRELQLSSGWFSIVVVAPIIGSFFAVLLYFLFVAGLLQGGFFPTFVPITPPKGETISISQFLDAGLPASIADWGKLMVWSFIAGFAERFVPGVLDRLSGDSSGSAADKPLIANTTNSALLIPSAGAGQSHAPALEDAEATK
ncbi:MAG: hypothetical protein M3169_08740 [Candidatus Eremiobacteraeota bacterium]|nr:hypothetical protein [Candidatus Eremiobacteraeota bacterium]